MSNKNFALTKKDQFVSWELKAFISRISPTIEKVRRALAFVNMSRGSPRACTQNQEGDVRSLEVDEKIELSSIVSYSTSLTCIYAARKA